jgi:hypothetical protein
MSLYCSNTGIVGSNLDGGIDVCPRLSVLCCSVYVLDVCYGPITPSKGSYENVSKDS